MSNSDPKTRRPDPNSTPPPPPQQQQSSWAKRTGFHPKFSGETTASDSGHISLPPLRPHREQDLEVGRVASRPPPVPMPVPPAAAAVNGEQQKVKAEREREREREKEKEQSVKRRRNSDGGTGAPMPKGSSQRGESVNGQAVVPRTETAVPPRRVSRSEETVDVVVRENGDDDDGFVARHSHMKYELRDSPGLGVCFISWILIM